MNHNIKFLRDCLVKVEIHKSIISGDIYFFEEIYFHAGETRRIQNLKSYTDYYQFEFVKDESFVEFMPKDYIEFI